MTADVTEAWANGKDRQALLVPGSEGQPLRPSTFRRQVHWTRTGPAGFRIHDLCLGGEWSAEIKADTKGCRRHCNLMLQLGHG